MRGMLGVCLVTQTQTLFEDVAFVVEQLRRGLVPVSTEPWNATACIEEMCRAMGGRPRSEEVLETLMVQAENYLQENAVANRQPLEVELLHFPTLEVARAQLTRHGERSRVGLFIVDACRQEEADEDPFDDLFAACRHEDEGPRLSPHSAVLYCSRPALPGWMVRAGGNRHLRVPLEDRAASRADLLRIAVDHLEHVHFNRMLARSVSHALPPVSIATEVTRFMADRWQDGWDFHSYTGSMVAGLIQSMQQTTAGSGVRCLHGCNEHGLAVAALAGWQLYGRAYVIAVTSGMIDEFRGTLANLKRAGAPGLIICADSPDNAWFAFQGTLDADHDGRQVIAARGLRYVFIRKVDEVAAKLSEAFALLAERAEPVFVLATQAVLESRPLEALGVPLPPVGEQPRPVLSEAQRAALEEALRLINQAPLQMLWQCGKLSDAQRERVYAIAEAAGIALADTITQPGSVGPYHQGRPVPNYLGPLSLYGFSRRVYRFLHKDHEVVGPDEQCLFFLKSKVDQAATPFSEGKLKRQVRVVQVNHEPRHLSPFTDLALDIPLDLFLGHVQANLAVDPEVLALRRARLASVRAIPEAVPVDHIATLPMTANYFFLRLGDLVRELIERHDYLYTGIYDVGRCGISALRNVPRTGPGFSGWYGRALMGDGLMALPYIAITTEGNVLAFIGDGARALVPDIETRLAASLAQDPRGATKSVTLFYLTNGVLSMIQTYLDKRYAHNGARQVAVTAPAPSPAVERVGPISVNRSRVVQFDPDFLRNVLTAPGQLNIIDVTLAHNSDGDGLSLVSETAWNRQ
ncbi:Acetolactate synthase large subunit [Pseudomonas indica]|uniref:Acetolactate synthase large subunit n=1 Tax=Pseudomonas indica TaxID=137658 RepID=A0A1G8VM93_9PSED|nr:Acetolactate synthase large subunit [Pseudomonas indica]